MRPTFQFITATACATLLAAPAFAEFRSVDGTGNNLAHPDYGRAGSDMAFTAPPAYADGLNAPAHPDFPNPRAVSNAVVQSRGDKPDPRGLSQFTWQWGQFIDHDLALVLPQPRAGGARRGGFPAGARLSARRSSRSLTTSGCRPWA